MTGMRLSFALLLVGLMGQASFLAQRPIVLRDLTLIADAEIVEFDAKQITLGDDRTLEWKDVLQAEVTAERQSEFDRLIRDVGLPRYRLELRLNNRDWTGAFEIAEQLIANQEKYPLTRFDEFAIAVATTKAQIVNGKRERAILPFLRSLELLPMLSASSVEAASRFRWSDDAVQLKYCEELMPVWFDRKGSAEALAALIEASDENLISVDRGASLYMASLALSCGQFDLTDKYLSSLDSNESFVDWGAILKAQRTIEQGELDYGYALLSQLELKTSGAHRAVIWYLQGFYFDEDRRTIESTDAMLGLLKLVAIHRDEFPDLAAASLYRAAEIATDIGNHDEAEILRNELLRAYPGTYHGRWLKQQR